MKGKLTNQKTIKPDMNMNSTYLKEKQIILLANRKLGKINNVGDESCNVWLLLLRMPGVENTLIMKSCTVLAIEPF